MNVNSLVESIDLESLDFCMAMEVEIVGSQEKVSHTLVEQIEKNTNSHQNEIHETNSDLTESANDVATFSELANAKNNMQNNSNLNDVPSGCPFYLIPIFAIFYN